jgi:Fic family protein
MMLLLRIDARLTDEKALEFLQKTAVNGVSYITEPELARLLKCHLNTAKNSLNRLERDGKIVRVGKRGRQSYRLVEMPCPDR